MGIEKYLTQHLHKPVAGRGSQVKLYTAPLASSSKPRVWKKGSAAFWEKMGIRLNLACHGRYPGILEDLKDMIKRIPQHASLELDQNHLRNSCSNGFSGAPNFPPAFSRSSNMNKILLNSRC